MRASVAKEAIRCNGQLTPLIFGHLTLDRAVDLFLGAKAAEGASPKAITWYRMILERAVRAFGADLPDPITRSGRSVARRR